MDYKPGHSRRQKRLARDLLVVMVLAWATQLLLSQWGYGAEPVERFVPPSGGFAPQATLELRSTVSVMGAEIRLKHLARWTEEDALAMAQTADLVIARFETETQVMLSAEQVRKVLEGAGVNLAAINFAGALSCKAMRVDAGGQGSGFRIQEKTAAEPVPTVPATRPAAPVANEAEAAAPQTLRDVLMKEISTRFGIAVEALEVRFAAEDERHLKLPTPLFTFDVQPRRERNLGLITWDVMIAGANLKQKASISANVRAWQQVQVTRLPMVYKQQFREQDVMEKRMLLDHLSEGGALTLEQVIGQQAARDIAAGTVLSARMIEPTTLARVGQLITVNVSKGSMQLKWVAEAREIGSQGQAIRVRKPGTREEFTVLLTGPQEGRLVGGAGGSPVASR